MSNNYGDKLILAAGLSLITLGVLSYYTSGSGSSLSIKGGKSHNKRKGKKKSSEPQTSESLGHDPRSIFHRLGAEDTPRISLDTILKSVFAGTQQGGSTPAISTTGLDALTANIPASAAAFYFEAFEECVEWDFDISLSASLLPRLVFYIPTSILKTKFQSQTSADRAFIRGLYLLSLQQLPEALSAFENAVDADPQCALFYAFHAYAEASLVQANASGSQPASSMPASISRVVAYFERAIRLDPACYLTYTLIDYTASAMENRVVRTLHQFARRLCPQSRLLRVASFDIPVRDESPASPAVVQQDDEAKVEGLIRDKSLVTRVHFLTNRLLTVKTGQTTQDESSSVSGASAEDVAHILNEALKLLPEQQSEYESREREVWERIQEMEDAASEREQQAAKKEQDKRRKQISEDADVFSIMGMQNEEEERQLAEQKRQRRSFISVPRWGERARALLSLRYALLHVHASTSEQRQLYMTIGTAKALEIDPSCVMALVSQARLVLARTGQVNQVVAMLRKAADIVDPEAGNPRSVWQGFHTAVLESAVEILSGVYTLVLMQAEGEAHQETVRMVSEEYERSSQQLCAVSPQSMCTVAQQCITETGFIERGLELLKTLRESSTTSKVSHLDMWLLQGVASFIAGHVDQALEAVDEVRGREEPSGLDNQALKLLILFLSANEALHRNKDGKRCCVLLSAVLPHLQPHLFLTVIFWDTFMQGYELFKEQQSKPNTSETEEPKEAESSEETTSAVKQADVGEFDEVLSKFPHVSLQVFKNLPSSAYAACKLISRLENHPLVPPASNQ